MAQVHRNVVKLVFFVAAGDGKDASLRTSVLRHRILHQAFMHNHRRGPRAAIQAPPASANPYGLGALWAQGDIVSRATLAVLVVMVTSVAGVDESAVARGKRLAEKLLAAVLRG